VAKLGENLWVVVEDLLGKGIHNISVGWTIPDVSWKLIDSRLMFEVDGSNVEVSLEGSAGKIGLYRGGTLVAGDEVLADPELAGWRSTRYAVKQPCLRLVKQFEVSLPARHCTWWQIAGANKVDVDVEWTDPGQGLLPFTSLHGQELNLDS
jgi:hypothetical protein